MDYKHEFWKKVDFIFKLRIQKQEVCLDYFTPGAEICRLTYTAK